MTRLMSLLEAVESGELAQVRTCLDAGSDVNDMDAEQRTPLMLAAAANRRDIAELLLAHGADPSLQDAMHETALLKAAANGAYETYAVLLKFGGDDERQLAGTLLRTVRAGTVGGEPPASEGGTWTERFARAGAAVSDVLGDEDPKARLARLDRARRRKP